MHHDDFEQILHRLKIIKDDSEEETDKDEYNKPKEREDGNENSHKVGGYIYTIIYLA